MRMTTDHRNVLPLLLLFGAVTYAAPAFAYLDPGTGSLLIQGAIGAIAAALFTLKLYWHKLKRFLFRSKTQEDSQDESIPKTDDSEN